MLATWRTIPYDRADARDHDRPGVGIDYALSADAAKAQLQRRHGDGRVDRARDRHGRRCGRAAVRTVVIALCSLAVAGIPIVTNARLHRRGGGRHGRALGVVPLPRPARRAGAEDQLAARAPRAARHPDDTSRTDGARWARDVARRPVARHDRRDRGPRGAGAIPVLQLQPGIESESGSLPTEHDRPRGRRHHQPKASGRAPTGRCSIAVELGKPAEPDQQLRRAGRPAEAGARGPAAADRAAGALAGAPASRRRSSRPSSRPRRSPTSCSRNRRRRRRPNRA